jgi:glycosyltransferase involved in cell wall biosynthesis
MNLDVGICHRSITLGDAIGNDILGMYDLLERMGFLPALVCELCHDEIRASKRVDFDLRPEHLNDYGLLIYHHSMYWEAGGRFFRRFAGEVIFKFHNITPPQFFDSYSPLYADYCRLGVEQTKEFARISSRCTWLADSAFNARDLTAASISPGLISVVPPFNRYESFLTAANRAIYSDSGTVELLFVGRWAPNKGHLDLLNVLDSYRNLVSDQVLLRIVGARNHELQLYYDEIDNAIDKLRLGNCIERLAHISDTHLIELFARSHVYVNLSRHEGFCVPVVEAQAVGLPVITTDCAALAETAGTEQLVASPPTGPEDYEFYALLIQAVCADSDLRKALIRRGQQNVTVRFSQETIENVFVAALEPTLRRLG